MALRLLLDKLAEEVPPPAPVEPPPPPAPTPAQRVIEQPVLLAPAHYVTIPLAAAITGLSEKAIRRKIEDGKWMEGREYRRSPDGGVFISMKAYSAWVESGALSGGARR